MKNLLSKISAWWQVLKEDFNAAVDAATKKQILDDARVIIDGLLGGHPVATKIADFLITELESTIK